MKKIFGICMGIGALLLGSCSSEEPVLSTENGGNVVFTATLPANMAQTRSEYDDGLTATKLDYAVYDAEGHNLPKLNGEGEFEDNSRQTTVSLNLVTGKTYTVVFWASAPAEAGETAPYNFDKSTGIVTVATDGNANDKKRDAFFAYEKFTVTGAINKIVELKRPFAQINIGTSDLQAFKDAGGEISTSGITVTAPNKLDLRDGSVKGEELYKFTPAEFLPETEAFPVTTTPAQRWLSTVFVLTDATKTTLDVTWTSDNKAPGRDAVNFTYVPVQRNYRTNIYGTLLTNPANYDVVINQEFAEFDYNNGNLDASFVETFDQLKSLLENGGNGILKNDIAATEPLVVNGPSIIDLNGMNLTFTISDQNESVLTINSGKNLKLVNGSVNSEGGYAAVKVDGGTLTLSKVNVSSKGADQSYAIYLDNSSTTGALNCDKSDITSNYCAVAIKSATNLTYPDNYVLITNSNLKGDEHAIWLQEYDAATQYQKLISLYIHNRNNTFTVKGSDAYAIKFGGDDAYYDFVSDNNDIYTLHDGSVYLRQYYNDEENIVIPDTYNGYPVTGIGYYVFNESSMTSITLPSTIKELGDRSFRRCKSLTTINLPEGLKTIGSNAFQSSGLTSVEIPASVTEICEGAFYESTDLASITLPIDLAITSIPANAFRALAITEINIPVTVTSIGNMAFRDNKQMAKINYGGTKAQWNAIEKGSSWALIASGPVCDLEIVCTDGILLLTGSRTGTPTEKLSE